MIIENAVNIANSDLVSGIANISQFVSLYQATKSATSAQLNTELINQNQHLENKLDEYTNSLLEKLMEELKTIEKQNDEIISILNKNLISYQNRR